MTAEGVLLEAPQGERPGAGGQPQPQPQPPPPRGVPRSLTVMADLSWRLLVCAAAIGVLGYVLWQVRFVVVPVFLALLCATLLSPLARWLERRRRLPPLAATLLVFTFALGAVAVVGTLLVPPVSSELGELDRQLRAGASQVGEFIASGPFGISEREINDAVERTADRLSDSGGALASGVLSGVLLFGQVIAGLLFSVVLAFFFVKDGRLLWGWVVGLFPLAKRGTVQRIGASAWQILGAYMRGVALVATVDAVLIGIALTIIGVPLVLPLAALTFMAALFPLIGAVVAGLAAALVALVSQGPVAALIVVGVVTLIQQLEGNLLYPVMVGRTVALHPVAILLAVAIGAVIGGVIGALVAVPLAAVLGAAVPIMRRAATAEALGAPQPTLAEELEGRK